MKTVRIIENTFCNGTLLLVSKKAISLDDRSALALVHSGKAVPAEPVAAVTPVVIPEPESAPVVIPPVRKK